MRGNRSERIRKGDIIRNYNSSELRFSTLASAAFTLGSHIRRYIWACLADWCARQGFPYIRDHSSFWKRPHFKVKKIFLLKFLTEKKI
jgi:hypothetical protein